MAQEIKRYRCGIEKIDGGMGTSHLRIISPTGNHVDLPIGIHPYEIEDRLWRTYLKLAYRKSWMTYLLLSKADMENVLEIKRRGINLWS